MVKMKSLCVGVAALAVMSMTASANLLSDPGFETGVPWTYFGDASAEDWANGAPGTAGLYGDGADGQLGVALKAWIAGTGGGGFGGVFQDVGLVSDSVSYTAGYEGFTEDNYAGSGGGSTAAAATVIKFEWYLDPAYTIGLGVDSIDIQPQIQADWVNNDRTDPNNWFDYSASALAPATGGSTYLRIVFAGEGFIDNQVGGQAFTFDNAFVVPEPGTAALVLLGLGGLAFRRRLNR